MGVYTLAVSSELKTYVYLRERDDWLAVLRPASERPRPRVQGYRLLGQPVEILRQIYDYQTTLPHQMGYAPPAQRRIAEALGVTQQTISRLWRELYELPVSKLPLLIDAYFNLLIDAKAAA